MDQPPRRGECPEFDAIVDATLRALDGPGGGEILDRMCDGAMTVPDGIVALLVMSGDYERRDPP